MDKNIVYAYVIRDKNPGDDCYLFTNEWGDDDFGPLVQAQLIETRDAANRMALNRGMEFVRVRLEVLNDPRT